MSEDSVFIMNVGTIFIAFQMKKIPENRFKLFLLHKRKFWRREKKRELQLMPLYIVHT